jgi:hypothetical protein
LSWSEASKTVVVTFSNVECTVISSPSVLTRAASLEIDHGVCSETGVETFEGAWSGTAIWTACVTWSRVVVALFSSPVIITYTLIKVVTMCVIITVDTILSLSASTSVS